MRGRNDRITPFAHSSAFTGSIQRNSTWPLWPGLYLWRFFLPASGRWQGHPQAIVRDGRHVLEDRDTHLDQGLLLRELVETCAGWSVILAVGAESALYRYPHSEQFG